MVGFQNAAGISLSAARRKLLKKPHSAYWSWGSKSSHCVGKDSRNVKLTISFYLAAREKTLGARCLRCSCLEAKLASFSLFESSETCPLGFKLRDRHSWRRLLQLCSWRCCAPSRQRSDWYYDRAFQRIVGTEEGRWTSKCTYECVLQAPSVVISSRTSHCSYSY